MGRMVIVCAILAVTVWLVRAHNIVVERPEGCEPCDPGACEPITQACPNGPTLDRCRCCTICAQQEHQLCDHPKVPRKDGVYYGVCGRSLECRVRTDLKDTKEAVCMCFKTGQVCGSNNVTYSSVCQLFVDKIKDKSLEVNYKGPCASAPTIITSPENIVAKVGGNYALSCEASGVPIPDITWTFTQSNGVTTYLPTDDKHVAINLRGGPEEHEVTGWVQVMAIIKEKHEGDYTCIVQNDQGVVQASARINVIETDAKKRNIKDEN